MEDKEFTQEEREEFTLVIGPIMLEAAHKLGTDIKLHMELAPTPERTWLVTGSVDGCAVVGYVRGRNHALWFANSIV